MTAIQPQRAAGMPPTVAAEVTSLSKSYDGVRVLHEATLQASTGHIHALVGGNGSGKSTLAKILAGAVRADPGGRIRVGEIEAESQRWTRSLSRRAHVHVVHQDPCVFANATVAENLSIGPGFVQGVGGRINWRATERRAQAVLDRFGVHATPSTYVGELRGAERTKLAIARALQDQDEYGSGLLILDEPTAALPAGEINRLLEWIKTYAAGGRAIIFVSHHLEEVLGLADEISVLRDGVLVDTRESRNVDEHQLVELITGRRPQTALPTRCQSPAAAASRAVLQVVDLSGGPVTEVSFSVDRGEILGIAGLLGSGRTTLLELIHGARSATSGHVFVDGKAVELRTPEDGVRAGFMYVPETRGLSGFFGMNLCVNLSATVVKNYAPLGRFRHRVERRDARQLVSQYTIRAQSLEQTFEHLSGGNQQKAILARSIRARPRVLLLDEPTQGVDVGARADIHAFLRDAATNGTSVVVVSSDLEELANISDRVVVLREGRIASTLFGPSIDPDAVITAVYEGAEANHAR